MNNNQVVEKLQKNYADLLIICFHLCEEVYAHIAEVGLTVENEKLKKKIDAYIGDEDFANYLQHKYILKDKYQDSCQIDYECESEDGE